MSERNELTERDRKLLEEIEEIVANGGGERREADSLYGFCAHLASTVPRADDDFRQRLESRLVARLQQQFPMGEACPPWFQRLALAIDRIREVSRLKGGMTVKRGFAFAALAALLIAVSTVAFVPSVRAQAGEILNTWFRFKSPSGEYEMAIGGPMEFTPLQPTYLPARFQGTGAGISAKDDGEESVHVELMYYYSGDQFVTITQTKAPADKRLPGGREVTVNGQKGVLVTGLKGTFEYGFFIPEDAQVEAFGGTPPAEPYRHHGTIAYIDGKRLIWYVGDVKLEMLSNLSEEEMLKIAESMVPAEAGEGESPFGPLLDLPSGSEGEPFIIQEGPIEANP